MKRRRADKNKGEQQGKTNQRNPHVWAMAPNYAPHQKAAAHRDESDERDEDDLHNPALFVPAL